MHLVVEVDKKMLMLLDLMLREERFDGVLTFKKDTATGGGARTIKFTHGVCVDYRETFDIDLLGGIGGMRLNFSIWFETIDVDSTMYNVSWKAESPN